MTDRDMELMGIRLTPRQRQSWQALKFCGWAIAIILAIAWALN